MATEEIHPEDFDTSQFLPSASQKLVILGATGGTGREILKQALEAGHKVTVIVRRPEAVGVTHENLTVIKCESLLEREKLTPLFEGHDAVISCLGMPTPTFHLPWSRFTFVQDSMRSIVPAMRMAKVNRLIALSSWFMDRQSKDNPAILRYYYFPFRWGKLVDDHNEMDKYVTRECPDVDYTLLRLPMLTDDPKSEKPVKLVEKGLVVLPNLMYMARADVARFALACLYTDRFNGKTPTIATH